VVPAAVLLLALALALAPATADAQGTSLPAGGTEAARATLRQAIDLYVVGRYQEAAQKLRPLVETRSLRDPVDQGEALRAYGISMVLIGARAGAARAFRDLLRIEPSARLDPAFVRPEVVEFFEQVRRQHLEDQNELLRRRGPKGSAAVNLLPPWGQFQNQHRRKAYALLGAELGLATLSVVTYGLLQAWAGDTQEFRGHENAYPALSVSNRVAFSTFVAAVVYGIVDGLYYYYRAPRRARLLAPDGYEELGSSSPSIPSSSSARIIRF
jgi:hypothetical protein